MLAGASARKPPRGPGGNRRLEALRPGERVTVQSLVVDVSLATIMECIFGVVDEARSRRLTRLFSEVEDPGERLLAIHRGTQAAKWEHQTFGPENLSGLAELTSVTTLGALASLYSKMKLADRHRPFHNLVISNVPGPRETLTFAGHRVRQMHCMGPVMEGAGLNLTVLSAGDVVGFSFHVDAELVPDVHEIPSLFADSLDELLAAARAYRAAKAARKEGDDTVPFALAAFAR